MTHAFKDRLARLVFGRRARARLAEARDDLGNGSVAKAVAKRQALPLGREAPWRLRGVARAIRVHLAAEGEARPCLPRALALLAEARHCGFEATLVLGVARGEPPTPLAAHAWLEAAGRPFFEAPATLVSYAEIARFPPAARIGPDP